MRREAEFTTVVLRSIRESLPNSWCYKLPDYGGSRERFALQLPFDVFLVQGGRAVGMELKWHGSPNALPFDRLEEHQEDYLIRFGMAGGVGLVVIGLGMPKLDAPNRLQPLALGSNVWACVVVPIKLFLGIRSAVEPRKSIKLADFLAWGGVTLVPWLEGKRSKTGKPLFDFGGMLG